MDSELLKLSQALTASSLSLSTTCSRRIEDTNKLQPPAEAQNAEGARGTNHFAEFHFAEYHFAEFLSHFAEKYFSKMTPSENSAKLSRNPSHFAE